MKDAFGTELHVGDIVAYKAPIYAELWVGEIIELTPKMVRVRALKPRTTEPLKDNRGAFIHCTRPAGLCVRIDVRAYLGLAS